MKKLLVAVLAGVLALSCVCAWADDDPIDDDERMYNDAVQEVQGNRNPFIDCPGLEKNISDFKSFSGQSTNNNLPNP